MITFGVRRYWLFVFVMSMVLQAVLVLISSERNWSDIAQVLTVSVVFATLMTSRFYLRRFDTLRMVRPAAARLLSILRSNGEILSTTLIIFLTGGIYQYMLK